MITLLIASLLIGDHQSASFSYFEPAAPLSRLMPALSKTLSLSLEVSPVLAPDIVCIDVHNVTPKDLLDRLAWATCAEWEPSKAGSYQLVPSDAVRTRQAADEIKRRAGRILKYLNPPRTWADDLKPRSPISGGELDGKPLLRFIDPTVLASIAEGTRAVFSTRPNRMQYPFSADISATVNSMIAKNNEKAEKLKNGAKPRNGEIAFRAQPIEGVVDKVLLIVTPIYFDDDEALKAEVRFYDKSGNDITGNHSSITGTDSFDDVVSNESKPVTLSHESKLFAQFVATEIGGLGMMEMLRFRVPNKPVTLSEEHRTEALQRFLSPDRYDPLAYVSDLLRSLAHVDNEQVVACLPDSFACNIGLVFASDLKENSLRGELSENKDMEIRSEDGWMVGRPRDPAASEAERVDRNQLTRTLAMLQTRDYIRLVDQVEVANLGFDLHPDSLVNVWCTLARPSYFASDRDDNWDMIRLFATLNEQQQQLLQSEHSLPLTVLTSQQSAILNRLVFGPKAGMFMQSVSDTENDSGYFDPEMTEVLPNGLPSTIDLSMSVTSRRAVQAMDRSGPKFRRVMGAEVMSDEALVQGAARLATIKSHARDFPTEGGDDFWQSTFATGIPTSLRVGSMKELEFRIQILKNLQETATLEDDDMSGNSIISFTELKSQLKSVYDEAVQVQESITSSLGGGGGGSGGAGASPPR